jgi:imidazole glycerol-phosphate synthase subunit HisH
VIAIVHYGLGNVDAIANIFKKLGVSCRLATTEEDVRAADKLILPGVGAFDWAIGRLNSSGMRDALERSVLVERKPLLGICVGMQMLAKRSDEGRLDGLGWIDGEVKRFDVSTFAHKTHLPHMGWNDVRPNDSEGLFESLAVDARFYFLHSYYFSARAAEDVLAVTHYNGVFASSVRSANVYGVQFHPEKSHQWGIRLLSNFAEL